MRTLLSRGLLAGLAGGVLAFAFAHHFGEPQVDRAIAFESARDAALGLPADPTIVSRRVQSSLGLLTGVCVYGVAFGGLFALAFAAAHGRIGRFRPRTTAAILALTGYVVAFVVPFIKYPANPPSIGNPDTIARRTELYVALVAISILAAVAAYRFGRTLVARLGAWNAALSGAALYLAVIAIAEIVLPGVHETPRGVSADVLWRFRLSSLGVQATLWTTLGLGFGALAERALAARAPGEARRVVDYSST
jgi:Probable cobalt transporter subunit (CbtA)